MSRTPILAPVLVLSLSLCLASSAEARERTWYYQGNGFSIQFGEDDGRHARAERRRTEPGPQATPNAPPEPEYYAQPVHPRLKVQYAALYGAVVGERFAIPAVELSQINANYLRRTIHYPSNEAPGTIIIDPQNRFLYLVMGGGEAVRYGIGVGRQGFEWSGVATIRDKQEWPDWYPPKEMLQRQPEIMRHMQTLRSGIGMAGGPRNPLGARAMYLWQGNKDTLYRIHGTNEPWTIGRSVSSVASAC
jgi:lipoprotein-anchoring transpeptidase ErfK/SrfK